MPNKLSQFWNELKRRRVIHVIVVYATAAFVILEAVDIIFPRLNFPDWTVTFVMILLAVGFPIAMIFSWIFDVTPEGLEKTKPSREVPKEEKTHTPNSWRIATYVSVVIIVGLIVFNVFGVMRGAWIDESLEKSIAVLPFDNMSDGEEFTWFGDAITDEIIMQLYKINSFVVRSRTSILQYTDTEKGSPEIGQELKVNYLLEGSAQRFGDRVRIRVQLIHASSDDHIWGEVYDRNWEEILDIQIDVAKKVAGELKAVLTSEELELIEKKPTEDLEAYNLYLLGRHFWKRRTEEDFKTSIRYFQQALEYDPGYALAYTGLADSYIVLSDWGYFDPKEGYLKAKEYVLKAMEINPDLAEAHASLAFLTYVYDRDWSEAEKEFKLAIEMRPDDAELHEEYAAYLSKLGRFDEAFDQINVALELDPASIISNIIKGRIFYLTRQYDEAISWYQKSMELESGIAEVYYYISLCYLRKGQHNEEVEIYQRGMSVNLENRDYIEHIRNIYNESGITGFHRWLIDKGIVLTWSVYNRPIIYAWYCTALGEYDQAFTWLDRALEMNTYYLTYLKSEPCFDSLHPDPRFHELVRRIGIEE